jgi:hypothetical protein
MTSLLTRESVRVVSLTAVVLAASLLLPLLFHLLPVSGGPPLGARLLPIFYAPLIAVLLFHPAVALTAALAAPSINHLLTGRPAPEMVPVLTLELLLFVGLILLARRRWPVSPLIAPLAYLLAKLAADAMLGLPWSGVIASLQLALPGVAILFALNLAVVLLQRRRGAVR